MRTIEKIRFKNILLFFLLGIFVAVAQAQVTKRDHRTKEKAKTRGHRTNRVAENDVAIDDSFNNFLVTNPPRSTQDDVDNWNRIVTKMQGIEGFDPVGNIIGEYPAEKTQGSEVVLHFFNNWVPLDSKKHACCGKLKKFKIYDGGNDEMDWGFYITPNDAFSYLIKDVLQFKDPDGYDAAWDGEFSLAGFHMGENAPGGWHVDEKFRDHRPGNEWRKYLLEGEITPDESLYDNVFFPKRGNEVTHASGDISYTPNLGSLGREICIYGPWVRERVHNNRPEIHPSDMVERKQRILFNVLAR